LLQDVLNLRNTEGCERGPGRVFGKCDLQVAFNQPLLRRKLHDSFSKLARYRDICRRLRDCGDSGRDPGLRHRRGIGQGVLRLHDRRRLRPQAPLLGRYKASNPAWRSGDSCFTDEGNGRFRPCSAGYKAKHTKK